jgi:hypothetical protein
MTVPFHLPTASRGTRNGNSGRPLASPPANWGPGQLTTSRWAGCRLEGDAPTLKDLLLSVVTPNVRDFKPLGIPTLDPFAVV